MSYELLSKIDVSEHVEKKGRFSYLSWAWAVNELLKVCPDATWEVTKDEGRPYVSTPAGCFVEVAVKIKDIVRSQIHPVLNHQNKTVMDPDAFQINTSIQRCLVKAIALHGLGLYIYAGEDLPKREKISTDPVNETLVKNTVKTMKRLIDDDVIEETHEKIKVAYRALNYDEKVMAGDLMSDIAPGGKKMYKNILKEYLGYRHESGN